MKERTGSIEPADGKFRVRVTLNNGKRRDIGRFATRAEAARELDEALKQIGRRAAGSSLADYIDEWLTARKAAGFREAKGDRNRFVTHLKADEIAVLDVRSVRRRDVLDWLVRMQEKKLGRQTIANVYAVLRGALSDALNRGKIRDDICSGVKIPKSPRTKEPWTYLDPEEQAAIVEAFPGAERFIVQFAIGSGLRAGELCALRFEDVDLRTKPGRITVRYGRAPARPTKNGKIRTIPLVPMARQALDAWLLLLDEYAPENPNGLVFPRAGGGFRDFAHVLPYPLWTSALTASGLTRRVRWHDLRHTCASSLVSGWWGRRWSLEEVRELLGHSSIMLTQRYAHLAGTAVEAAANEMPSIGIAPALPRPKAAKEKSPVNHRADFEGRTRDLRFTKPSETGGLLEGNTASGQLRGKCAEYIEAISQRNASRAERLRRELSAMVFGDTRRTIDFCEAMLSSSLAADAFADAMRGAS